MCYITPHVCLTCLTYQHEALELTVDGPRASTMIYPESMKGTLNVNLGFEWMIFAGIFFQIPKDVF